MLRHVSRPEAVVRYVALIVLSLMEAHNLGHFFHRPAWNCIGSGRVDTILEQACVADSRFMVKIL